MPKDWYRDGDEVNKLTKQGELWFGGYAGADGLWMSNRASNEPSDRKQD